MEAIKRSKPFMGNEPEPVGAIKSTGMTPPEYVDAEDRISMRHNFAKILIMVANYYGAGDTVEEAKASLKKIRGRALKVKEAQIWWVVSEDTHVSDVDGMLMYPRAGSKPFEINRIES